MTPFNWTARLNSINVLDAVNPGYDLNIELFDMVDGFEDGEMTLYQGGFALIARGDHLISSGCIVRLIQII